MTVVFLVMSISGRSVTTAFGDSPTYFWREDEGRKNGLPLIALLFLFIGAMELVSILFARPVALAMRLFGIFLPVKRCSPWDFTCIPGSEHWQSRSIIYFYETFVCAGAGIRVRAAGGCICRHDVFAPGGGGPLILKEDQSRLVYNNKTTENMINMLADAVPTLTNPDIKSGMALVKTGIAMAGASIGIGMRHRRRARRHEPQSRHDGPHPACGCSSAWRSPKAGPLSRGSSSNKFRL